MKAFFSVLLLSIDFKILPFEGCINTVSRCAGLRILNTRVSPGFCENRCKRISRLGYFVVTVS